MITAQMLRFGLVGGVGFVVDSSVLYALMAGGMGFGYGRIVSFLSAVLVTWLLNRRFTFHVTDQASLVQEAIAYLSAMTLGGLLNLVTYALIMAAFTYHPILPMLGVAGGSLVGMVANFSAAKWWVYRAPSPTESWRLDGRDVIVHLAVQLLFWAGVFHYIQLPGLFMDAVNPEYLAARTLNPELRNQVFALPTVLFPLLGNLYHGMQNYYIGLPVFAAFGLNVVSLRIAQALFGAATVSMVYVVAERTTSSRALAFLAAAGLATDTAFVASFRTQFHIVLAGAFWLLCSVYWALPSRTDSMQQRHRFGSGVFFGLAVYAYFVYLFFLPAMLVFGLRNTRSWRSVLPWALGFVVGMLPYVLGYLSLTIALGGIEPMLLWVTKTINGLAPLSSKLSAWESLSNSFRNASYAIQNTGNELMIFGTSPAQLWPQVKLAALSGSLLWVGIWSLISRVRAENPRVHAAPSILQKSQLLWLPICYFSISLLLGNRLWIHHFAVLLPLLYVMVALALQPLTQWAASSLPTRAVRNGVLGLAVLLVVGNFSQQNLFFARLDQTGGVGKMSNAINRMAEDALAAPVQVVYIFPEWGFFMPFSFLTANRRPYEVEISSITMQGHARQGHEIRLAYWSAADDAKYEQILRENGFRIVGSTTYFQRDQQPAFRVIQGSPK